MTASIVAPCLKRTRPQDCDRVAAAKDDSSKRPRASVLGLALQQHQQPSKVTYQPRHSSHPSDDDGMVKAHRPSPAQPNGRTIQRHHAPLVPASTALQRMYQPFLRQLAAGIAAGLAATTAANTAFCSPEACGHGRYLPAASCSGSASAAVTNSAAELLLMQLASQGIDITAFLQPMVQMVASLSAQDISSSCTAHAAAGRTTAPVASGGHYSAAAGTCQATADAATWSMQQGTSAVQQGSHVAKSRVPPFSSEAQLAAQEQLATTTTGWSAAAAAAAAGIAGSDSCRITVPAESAGAAAAVQDAAACWDQARCVQQQSSSPLLAVLARVLIDQGPDAVGNQQQRLSAAYWQQQQHVQQAADPASPDVQVQQQQPVQLQQGTWMSSSSSSAASSSAAGGAAAEGLMSPTGSITDLMPLPAAARQHQQPVQQQQQQQGMLAWLAQFSQISRQWQCSSSAVPSYAANADPSGAAAAAGSAATGRGATLAAQGRQEPQHHTQQTAVHAAAAAAELGQPAQPQHTAVEGVMLLRSDRAAPGPAASQVINQQRQHILALEQALGNMHPQVGRAYLSLTRLLYQEGSTWSLTMARRAQQRAAHIMQAMQQAAAPASVHAVQAQPAPRSRGSSRRTAAKGEGVGCSSSLQQQGEVVFSALAAAGDVADAVVRVVSRRPALAGMVKQPKVDS